MEAGVAEVEADLEGDARRLGGRVGPLDALRAAGALRRGEVEGARDGGGPQVDAALAGAELAELCGRRRQGGGGGGGGFEGGGWREGVSSGGKAARRATAADEEGEEEWDGSGLRRRGRCCMRATVSVLG